MHRAILEQAKSRGDVCGVRLYVERENKTAKTVYAKVGLQTSSYHVFENDFVFSRNQGRARKKR